MAHYSLALQPAKLAAWAQSIAQNIKDREIECPILVYRGMSGIAHATAVSLHLETLGVAHGMVYVRKQHEKSHGSAVEQSETVRAFDADKRAFIFVDDFVDSGETQKACADVVYSHFDRKRISYAALQNCNQLHYDS